MFYNDYFNNFMVKVADVALDKLYRQDMVLDLECDVPARCSRTMV